MSQFPDTKKGETGDQIYTVNILRVFIREVLDQLDEEEPRRRSSVTMRIYWTGFTREWNWWDRSDHNNSRQTQLLCVPMHTVHQIDFQNEIFFRRKKTKTLSSPVCSRSTGLWNVFRYISVPYHRHIEKIKNKKFFRSINCRYISKREPRSFNRRLPLVPNFDSTLSSTSFLFPSMIRYFYFFWDFWRLVPDSHLTAGVTLPLLLSYFHFLFCFVLFSRLHTPVHHHDHQWSFVSFRNWWTAIFLKNIYRTQNTTRWTVLLIKERKWLKGFFVSDTIWKIVCVPPSSGAHVRARKLTF